MGKGSRSFVLFLPGMADNGIYAPWFVLFEFVPGIDLFFLVNGKKEVWGTSQSVGCVRK